MQHISCLFNLIDTQYTLIVYICLYLSLGSQLTNHAQVGIDFNLLWKLLVFIGLNKDMSLIENVEEGNKESLILVRCTMFSQFLYPVWSGESEFLKYLLGNNFVFEF